ncbi:hypothetical protein HZA98_02065 [Candidatus Woesearchaeota archaeon]|nr:hypothetical protein [Candidatus Woesearchaeota archaeon]
MNTSTLENRNKFLKEVYLQTDGNENKPVNMFEIGEKIDISRIETENIYNFLNGEKFIEAFGLGGDIRITHLGIKHYEGLDSSKINTILPFMSHIGDHANIQVQIESPNSFQEHLEKEKIKGSQEESYTPGIICIFLGGISLLIGINDTWKTLGGKIFLFIGIFFIILGLVSFKYPRLGPSVREFLVNLKK